MRRRHVRAAPECRPVVQCGEFAPSFGCMPFDALVCVIFELPFAIFFERVMRCAFGFAEWLMFEPILSPLIMDESVPPGWDVWPTRLRS